MNKEKSGSDSEAAGKGRSSSLGLMCAVTDTCGLDQEERRGGRRNSTVEASQV